MEAFYRGARAHGFELPFDAMWSTVMVLLCFGRAERYLGMLSLVLGDLATAEEYLRVALEACAGSSAWASTERPD
jgi:hypothetical protein